MLSGRKSVTTALRVWLVVENGTVELEADPVALAKVGLAVP